MASPPVNVPNAPGVPALNFVPGIEAGMQLLTGDNAPLFSGVGSQWGIFLNGVPVVTADNVVSFEFKQEFLLSDFPVEQGGFETYDRVQVPFDARIRFSSGGSDANRAALLNSIATVARPGNTTLYDVATPEKVYTSVSLAHQDIRRTAVNGVKLLVVDVWLLEVRLNQSTSLSNTQTPSGADQTNGGNVQPQSVNQPLSIQQTLGPTSGLGTVPPISIQQSLAATSGLATTGPN